MGDKTLTTFEVSRICDVYPTTVINWIEDGKLTAYKTPGGHRRVKRNDLMAFLEKYNIPSNMNLKQDVEYKLLIIDDTDNIAEIVKNMDTKLAFSIKKANTEFDAGLIIGEWKPDLILIDFSAAYVNCTRICRRVKSDSHLRNIYLIGILDHDDNNDNIQRMDADFYLNKPVHPAQISKKIEILLI